MSSSVISCGFRNALAENSLQSSRVKLLLAQSTRLQTVLHCVHNFDNLYLDVYVINQADAVQVLDSLQSNHFTCILNR
jgi:hypothetical protein